MNCKTISPTLFLISSGLHSQGADAHLYGCNTVSHVKPSLNIEELGSKKYNVFISSRIQSTQTQEFTEKGCGRDTYALDSLYKRCELPKNIVLLPSQESVPDYKWIAAVNRRTTPRGEQKHFYVRSRGFIEALFPRAVFA